MMGDLFMPFSPEFDPIDATTEVLEDTVAPDDLVTISRWELEALRAKALGATPVAPTTLNPAPISSVTSTRPEDAAGRKLVELERGYKAAVRDRELATALAGRNLLPGAASQLIKLWRDDFDVFEEGGEFRVSARDGMPVAKAIAERLTEAEYAHFLPPSSRGGATAKGSARSVNPESSPRTLGEAVLKQWRESAAARLDPASGPIGLRRR